MTTRIFSKKNNLYTNSPFWPSNQRTISEFVLDCQGNILEIISNGEEDGFPCIVSRDKRDFIIEPWSGYFDVKGRKIYRGDILAAENDSQYCAKVIWFEGGFYAEDQTGYKMPLHIENKAWKRHIITGNIHGVEYAD